MATTIQSGRSSSPLLTADVASRAEVYGGRGLVFDAVSDYLSVSNISFTGEFTISCWFKADDLSSGRPIVGDTGNSHWFKIADTDTVALNVSGSNTEWDSGAVFSTGVWTFVSVVRDSDNKIIIYKDGIGYTSNQPTKSGTFTTNAIGQKGNSQYFDGTISDIKFYSSALTEAEVQSQYLKPESVPSPSTLVAWYPMSEANPESPQSIVYDHSEKKLDTNLVTNGTFDSDISGWSQNNSDSERTIAFATIDGRTCIEINDQSSSRFTARFDLGANSVDGELYKISYYARKSQTDSTNKYYAVGIGVEYLAITGGTFKSVAEYDTWEYHELYFVADTSSNFLEFMSATAENGGNNAFVGKLYLDDVKVQKVLMGNHATTKFYGSELVDTNARTFEGTSTYGWLVYANNTITNDSNTLKITEIDSSQGAYWYLRNSKDLSTDLTIGATYLLKGDFLTTDASKTFTARVSNGSQNITYAGLNNTSFVTKEFELTAQSASDAFLVIESMQTDGIVKIDNLTLKEVGVLSTGFTTAQNEPVIPQIPLVKYNEKMLFDGVDDKVVLDGAIGALATQQGTINLWCIPSRDTEEATNALFAYNWNANRRDMILRYNWGDNRLEAGLALTAQQWHFYTPTNSVTNHVGSLKMITLTHDGTQPYLYVDGVLQSIAYSSQTDKTKWLGDFDFANRCSLGLWQYTSDQNQFNGIIDDVSYFNTALDSTQIQELFNDGIALDATNHSKSGNLLGYWRNDGVTTWTDRSTNSNHGTVAGTPDSITIREGLTSNKDGLGFPLTNPSSNVLRLNGSNEYLNLGSPTSLTDIWQTGATVEMWLKPEGSTGNMGIMHKSGNGNQGWQIKCDSFSGGKWHIRLVGVFSGDDYVWQKNAYLTPDIWSYWAITWTSIAGGSATWYSSNEAGVLSQITSPNVDNTSTGTYTSDDGFDLIIGSKESNSTKWNGMMDEIMIYNRILTSDEISKNFKYSKGKHKND